MFNFFAIEPVVGGQRGYSELEKSKDGKPGRRLTVSDDLKELPAAGAVVTGRIDKTAHGQALTFFIHVERFSNGAEPIIGVTFSDEFPQRVQLRTYAAAGSKPMEQCIITATMGSQPRCNWLWLDKKAIFAPELYAGYRENWFVEHEPYKLDQLHRTPGGDVVAAISANEFDPREVWPAALNIWHHDGKWLAHYWMKPKGTFDDSLLCRVNGRYTYWAGDLHIPGGTTYENFEFQEKYREGSEVDFGYTTDSPAKEFGFAYDVAPWAAALRTIGDEEQQQINAAAKSKRALTNVDFRNNFDGWQTEGGAAAFKPFFQENQRGVTTFASKDEGNTGRLSQSFVVPDDANQLRFFQHGGADWNSLYIALWDGRRLYRKMTGADSTTPFVVRWDLKPMRGHVVTLEIVDNSTAAHGSIGIRGLKLLTD